MVGGLGLGSEPQRLRVLDDHRLDLLEDLDLNAWCVGSRALEEPELRHMVCGEPDFLLAIRARAGALVRRRSFM